MKKLLISLVVSAMLWAAPVSALTVEQAEKAAKWAGFKGIISIDRDVTGPNGWFSVRCPEGADLFDYEACVPYVTVEQPEWMPDSWAYVILFHELGHWTQWRGGYIREMESIDREWQADIWGMRAAQAYGVDLWAAHDLWATMIDLYGNRCSYSHGCPMDRLANLMRYARETLSRLEAPWTLR